MQTPDTCQQATKSAIRADVVTDLGNRFFFKISQFNKRLKKDSLNYSEIGAAMVATATHIGQLNGGNHILLGVLTEMLTDSHLLEVAFERGRQDEKHGGPEFDDAHSPADWVRFIREKANFAATAGLVHVEDGVQKGVNLAEYRRRMIQIAALAVAAVESMDRVVEVEPADTEDVQANDKDADDVQ